MKPTLYQMLQANRPVGSGTGQSFYSVAASCGMKARLRHLYPAADSDDDSRAASQDTTGQAKRKVNGRRAGAFFHQLQEMWRLNAIPEDVCMAATHDDYDYEIGLRSFTQYRFFFNDNRHNLGRVRGAEVRLPANEEQAQAILDFTDGVPFTMRYDLLTSIDSEDIGRIAVERQLALPGEGDYLVDYKLVYSIQAQTAYQYSYDFQQMAYPVIYNLCFPDSPVKGMLTEAMARVQKPEARHFALYLAYADSNAKEIVREGIRLASRNFENGTANPFSCIGKYGPCYFLSRDICPRHGRFVDYTWDKNA